MAHLVRRFIGFLTARPLTPAEQEWVSRILDVRLKRLFFAQQYQDQRHAVEVAHHAGEDRLLQAALLHDVGKSISSMGALSRSLATLWARTGLPVWGRWRTYLRHGVLGASMLERAGADPLTVAFARYHPGPTPDGIDSTAWRVLAVADHV